MLLEQHSLLFLHVKHDYYIFLNFLSNRLKKKNVHYSSLPIPVRPQLFSAKDRHDHHRQTSFQLKSQFQGLTCFVFLRFLQLASPSIVKHTDLLKSSLLKSKSKSFIIVFILILPFYLPSRDKPYQLGDSSSPVQDITLGFIPAPLRSQLACQVPAVLLVCE